MRIPNSYNKYSNTKVTIDGISFDSKREATRYTELKLLFKAGKIKDLRLQPEFNLQEGFRDKQGKWIRPIIYIADFSYWETKDPGTLIIEDVKGMKTKEYLLKKKILLYKFRHFVFREI